MVTLLLATFSVGVGIGSLLIGRLRAAGATNAAPLAGLGLSLATGLFVLLAARPDAAAWTTPSNFLAGPSGIAALLALLAASAAGGAFSVPLYARLQTHATPDARARTIAANNVMNALAMVVGAAVIAGLAAIRLAARRDPAAAAGLNLAVVAWLWRALRRTPMDADPAQPDCRQPIAGP